MVQKRPLRPPICVWSQQYLQMLDEMDIEKVVNKIVALKRWDAAAGLFKKKTSSLYLFLMLTIASI